MSVLTSGFGSSEQPQYQISRSLRFNSADSAYLNRTPASAGNRKTWTFSCWLKLASLTQGERNILFGPAGGEYGGVTIYQDAGLRFAHAWDPLGIDYVRETVALFRDPSAWYHVVWWCDTTQSGTRWKIYVNGILQTLQTPANNNGEPAQNTDLAINSANVHYLGGNLIYGYFSGLMTEVNFIDGQALTPSSFGEFDNTTGVWKPKKYTGTYGTNGFYLNFSDNSNTTATTLGKDSSGNNNNWTPNNFSVTAGAGNDSMVDTPTPYGTDTGVGGEVRGNYCTLNPLVKSTNTSISNGNLYIANTSTSPVNQSAYCTIPVSSGKWYFEVLSFSNFVNGQAGEVGIALASNSLQDRFSTNSNAYTFGFGYGIDKWFKRSNNVYTQLTLTGVTSGITVMRVAVDLDNGKMWVAKDSSWENSGNPASGTNPTSDSIPTGLYVFGATAYKDGTLNIDLLLNFGQRPFAYTAPSGFKALCTTNLPEPTIKKGADHFNTVTYTGNGGTNSITGVGFAPGFTWIKSRSVTTDHALYDFMRGSQKQLESNTTDAETTESNGLISFNTDGFTVGSLAQVNTNAASYVAWNWKGSGFGVTNTQGTITSQVSANPTAGFSMVTYTGTGSTVTVGHGLGIAPSMVVHKQRDQGTHDWLVYHKALGVNSYLRLNKTNGSESVTGLWTSTSTTFGSNYAGANPTLIGNHIFYCFAEILGYSAFGSYTGNGSTDGPFVYTGFRPAYVLIKRIDFEGSWVIFDNKRDSENFVDWQIYPNSTSNEGTSGAIYDFLSNGFKSRNNTTLNTNASTYIYAAFAENPFKYALAR